MRDMVQVTVYCNTWADERTADVLEAFAERYQKNKYRMLVVRQLPLAKLFRRAIGRNDAAKRTIASVVWFTDCDYLFYGECLQRAAEVAELPPPQGPIFFPTQIQGHKTHDIGDRLVDLWKDTNGYVAKLALTNPDDFKFEQSKKAIGGIQIVNGDYCRTQGYLGNHRRAGFLLRDVDPAQGFQSCLRDPEFRRHAGGSDGIVCPGVYRLRHSRAGRDGGVKNHGKK